MERKSGGRRPADTGSTGCTVQPINDQLKSKMFGFKRKLDLYKKSFLGPLFGTVASVRTRTPAVALTFDDGPDPEDTPKVLRLLDRYNARATFFMLGVRAAQYPELVAQVARSGNSIGNHGWSHTSLPLLTRKGRRQEINRTREILKPYGSDLFRPPYGHMNFSTYLDIRRCGYTAIAWDIVATDWIDHPDREIFNAIEKKIHPGAIILLHDSLYTFQEAGHRNRQPMLSALERLLKQWHKHFAFLSIPELLEQGSANKEYWVKLGQHDWLSNQKNLGATELKPNLQ
jgi:peptidoglycan/xylan/chitin deacetylase (PgdA/CDA1 family)